MLALRPLTVMLPEYVCDPAAINVVAKKLPQRCGDLEAAGCFETRLHTFDVMCCLV